MRAYNSFAKIGLLGIMVLFWIVCSPLCEAFPLEQFKDFINNKPTIEDFSFEVSTTKFRLSGLDPSIFRHFTLIMQNEDIYRLTEDKSGYFMKVKSQISGFTNNDGLRILPYVPQREASWGRYENQFWNTFNLSDVMRTTIQRSNSIPDFGPARGSDAMLRIAYDALNFGIMDLRTIGVTWSDLNFICLSNVAGCKVSGHLELDDSGVPKDALYTLSNNSGSYPYKASYYFATNTDLPDYMPSRIKIIFLGGPSPMVMSDYKILKLATSSHLLSISDVALVSTTNTQEYIYTNKIFTISIQMGGCV